MPGSYPHYPTVQATRDGQMVYGSATSNWIVVAAANDFIVECDDHYFRIDEQKYIPIRVTNKGSTAATAPVITVQVNGRFNYILGCVTCDGEEVTPKVERFEGGGLYVEMPDSVSIPAGGTMEFRFPVCPA